MKPLTIHESSLLSEEERQSFIEKRQKHLNAPSRQEVEELLDWVIEQGGVIECDTIIAGQIK